jgi:TPP-dependent pyruvate/acetoin dehydrogenase alpha subunit
MRAPAAARIEEAYRETRRTLVTELGRQAEAAGARIKAREGFARLSADDAHRVQKPLQDAVATTSAEALYPTLVEVRDTFVSRLRDAEERANQLLDELLSQRDDQQPVIRVEARVAGREIANRAQLDALLKEIEEAVMAQLDKNRRVRLV